MFDGKLESAARLTTGVAGELVGWEPSPGYVQVVRLVKSYEPIRKLWLAHGGEAGTFPHPGFLAALETHLRSYGDLLHAGSAWDTRLGGDSLYGARFHGVRLQMCVAMGYAARIAAQRSGEAEGCMQHLRALEGRVQSGEETKVADAPNHNHNHNHNPNPDPRSSGSWRTTPG